MSYIPPLNNTIDILFIIKIRIFITALYIPPLNNIINTFRTKK